MPGGSRQALRKVLRSEVGREDLPVLAGVDFGHRTPMTVLPVGAMAEVGCDAGSLAVLESGTAGRETAWRG